MREPKRYGVTRKDSASSYAMTTMTNSVVTMVSDSPAATEKGVRRETTHRNQARNKIKTRVDALTRAVTRRRSQPAERTTIHPALTIAPAITAQEQTRSRE